MIKALTTSFIRDALHFLKAEKEFFGSDSKNKEKKAQSYFSSLALGRYLASMTAVDFLDDMKKTVKIMKGSVEVKIQESKMIEAIAHYFLNEFPEIFDQIDKKHFELSDDEKKKHLQKLLDSELHFFSALRDLLKYYSVQEMSENIMVFLRDLYNCPRIVVQSPVESNRKTKTDIRNHFLKKHPQTFIAFSINPQLLGGIRFFIDGEVKDLTWFSKLQDFHTLYTLQY